MKNPKDSTACSLELITREPSKISRCNINIKGSVVFLYTCNNQCNHITERTKEETSTCPCWEGAGRIWLGVIRECVKLGSEDAGRTMLQSGVLHVYTGEREKGGPGCLRLCFGSEAVYRPAKLTRPVSMLVTGNCPHRPQGRDHNRKCTCLRSLLFPVPEPYPIHLATPHVLQFSVICFL